MLESYCYWSVVLALGLILSIHAFHKLRIEHPDLPANRLSGLAWLGMIAVYLVLPEVPFLLGMEYGTVQSHIIAAGFVSGMIIAACLLARIANALEALADRVCYAISRVIEGCVGR